MNGLQLCGRVYQQDIDAAAIQQTFSARRQPRGQPDSALQQAGTLHEQVHVTPARLIVQPGAKQQNRAIRAQLAGKFRFDG